VLGWRTRRRGRAAGTDSGGRGGSAPATARARPGQQVAHDGFIGSKEGIGAVARSRKAGRGAARRQQHGWRDAVAMPTEEGEMRGIYRRGLTPGVTAADVEDAAVVPGLGRCAYGGAPPSDRRSVARARPVRRGHDDARPREDSQEPWGAGAWGRCGLGRRAALGGVRRGRQGRPVHATSRRCPGQTVLPVTTLKMIVSKILYISAPNVEYESCRSSFVPLSKKLYSVFLNRFFRKGLPTLNATQSP
jgi:hypothetical protein